MRGIAFSPGGIGISTSRINELIFFIDKNQKFVGASSFQIKTDVLIYTKSQDIYLKSICCILICAIISNC
jgi:hypothetical protein